MNSVYPRQNDHKSNYVSPLKSRNVAVSSVTPKTQKKPYGQEGIGGQLRPVSPMESRVSQALTKTRKESQVECDRLQEVILLNERLRQEADFWHRKCLDCENLNRRELEQLELKEVQKLIFLCEKQAGEIREWKQKCEHLESLYSGGAARFESSAQEIQEQLKNVDGLYSQLNEQAAQIIRLQRSEETLKLQCQKLFEEAQMFKKNIGQMQKESQLGMHTRDQQTASQLDTLQQSHMKQIHVLNEQISNLQQEIIRKSEQNEQVRRDYEEAVQEIRMIQDNADAMANNLQQLETQIQQMKEDKRKEISQLQQAKEQQLTSLNKLNSDQRQQFATRQGNLEQQIKELQTDQLRMKNESTQHAIQLQDTQTQIKIYQENIEQLQNQHQIEIQQLNDYLTNQNETLKATYQRQLDQLVDEVEKLKNILTEKIEECEQNKQAVEELSGYLENAELNENELLKELEKWKVKYEELEHHCEQEIQKIDDEHGNYVDQLHQNHHMQLENLEHQLKSMQNLYDQKLKDCEDLRMQKNELALKLNELNLINQQLNGEVETLAQKFMEHQRQYEIEDQVKEEIKRSQLEQVRRQMEAQLDQLGNENRNLKFLLDGKVKECEDWKQSFLRSRPNQSTMN